MERNALAVMLPSKTFVTTRPLTNIRALFCVRPEMAYKAEKNRHDEKENVVSKCIDLASRMTKVKRIVMYLSG